MFGEIQKHMPQNDNFFYCFYFASAIDIQLFGKTVMPHTLWAKRELSDSLSYRKYNPIKILRTRISIQIRNDKKQLHMLFY
jgi:hypothetical protein